MSRRDDLAYGDFPQRWDRDRFERFGGRAAPRYEEDYRYEERDRPGRQDVAVQDRIQTAGPRGRYEERDRFFEQDQYTPAGRRRRTDRELFGDQDPREIANMALMPYQGEQQRGKSATRRDVEIDIHESRSPPPPRPGMIRRQSSLDTFDRRPIPRYEREEYRIPAPPPPQQQLPMRRREVWTHEEDYAPIKEREDYRDVEIQRERSVHSHRPKSVKSSKAKSVTTRRSSSSSSSSYQHVDRESSHAGNRSIHESIHESQHGGNKSFHESFHESYHGGASSVHDSITDTQKQFKKGKTRMPKRLVRREAIMDLGYPFDEEEDFFVLRIALEKDQIDQVIKISETYKSGEKKTVYKYEEKIDEAPDVPQNEHEEVLRTEWINPPTVVGSSHHRSRSHSGRTRDHSSSGSSTHRARSRHTSHSRHKSKSSHHDHSEHRTVYETRSPPPPPAYPQPPPPQSYYEERKTVVEEREGDNTLSPTHSHHRYETRSPSHGGALVLQEREYRSDRDIQTEITKLEAERRALRLEREADERRDKALQIRTHPEEEYQLVEYERVRPAREVLEVYDRDRSPPRNTVRVEKDRKERRKARVVAAAMATLT